MRARGLPAVALALTLASAAFAQSGAPPKPQAGAPPKPQAQTATGAAPDLAYAAYQRGLYVAARTEALARIEKNPADAAALTLLGELFNQGLGVPQDPVKAAEWYRRAAARGDGRALAALGLMALDGRGMQKNPQQGKAWLEQAAAKGEPVAAYNVALLLLSSGAGDDLRRAVELLRTAARAEIGDAQHALGVLYLRGRGIDRDSVEAARWLRKAAENGNTAGEVEYAILLFNGDGVTADERQAVRYFRRAAVKGNAVAQNRLARLYVAGRGVPKNLVEAAGWHLAAAGHGLTDSWLDAALRDLSAEDRAKAERLAAQRAGLL